MSLPNLARCAGDRRTGQKLARSIPRVASLRASWSGKRFARLDELADYRIANKRINGHLSRRNLCD